MKRGFLNFLQLFLPLVAILAILPYEEVRLGSGSDGLDLGYAASQAAEPVFSIVALNDEEEALAFRRAKLGVVSGNANAGAKVNLRTDLLMRELIADDTSRDSGLKVDISPLELPIVSFELGAYAPSAAAAKPVQLPTVKVLKEKRVPSFSRAELLNLPD